MKKIVCIWILLVFVVSCNSSDDDVVKDSEVLLQEIESLSQSVVCEDGSQWDIINFGYGVCGFTTQKMAFHTSVNNEVLQSKITAYTALQKEKQSNEPEIACLSKVAENLLVNTTEFVSCNSGESIISTKSQLSNDPLIGEWQLESAQQINGKKIEFVETTIVFDNDGFNYNSEDCSSEGTYSYDTSTGSVNLSSSNCNETANMFIYEYNNTSLIIQYIDANQSDVWLESYKKVLQ